MFTAQIKSVTLFAMFVSFGYFGKSTDALFSSFIFCLFAKLSLLLKNILKL